MIDMIQFFMARGDWAAVVACFLGLIAVIVHFGAALFARKPD